MKPKNLPWLRWRLFYIVYYADLNRRLQCDQHLKHININVVEIIIKTIIFY